MRIVTNFERFETTWTACGEGGEAVMARTFAEFLRALPGCDLILINGDLDLTLRFIVYFLMFPWKRRPIVVVDLVLRRPRTLQGRLKALVRRLLLSRVDHFIHYFKDLDGYSSCYGITPERSSYVAFKPNLRYRYEPRLGFAPGGLRPVPRAITAGLRHLLRRNGRPAFRRGDSKARLRCLP